MSIFGQVRDLSEVPAGSKIINADKLAGFYDIAVQTWKPQREVWALKYGSFILGATGSMSAWYGSLYFRKKLRLRNFGFVSMYLPNLFLPFMIVGAMHNSFTIKNIYIQSDQCTICLEAKSAGIQLFFGLVQPLLLVPASGFMFATRHFTHRIPSPINYPRDFRRFLKQLYSPLKIPMTINSFIQVGMAMTMTHIAIKELHQLNENMLKPVTDDTDDTDDKEE